MRNSCHIYKCQEAGWPLTSLQLLWWGCANENNSLDLNCPSKSILNYKLNQIQSIPAPSLVFSTINFPDSKEVGTNHSLFKLDPSQWQMLSCFSLYYDIFCSFAGAAVPVGRDRLTDCFPLCVHQIK